VLMETLALNKPVVITRILGGIGDCVMVRPAVNAFITQNPQTEVYIRTSKPLDEIFQDLPVAGILLDAPNFECEEFDLNSPCLDYELSNHPFVVVNNKKLVKRDKNIVLSRQEVFCNKLGVKFDISNYNVRFTDKELEFANEYTKGLNNLLIVHCNSNEPSRNYRYEIALLDYLSKKWDGNILAIRPKKEPINSKILVWGGNYSLRQLWAVMNHAKVFIGVDSGPIHMAGALGIPVYGIFGPIDPAIRLKYKRAFWKPITCKHSNNIPCWYTPCKGAYCMNRYPKEICEDFIKAINSKEKDVRRATVVRKSNIGIILLEGLGGTVTVSDYVKKIYDLLGIKTDIIIRKYGKIFDGNPYINNIYEVGSLWYGDCRATYGSKYSYLIMIKTAVGIWDNLNLTGFNDDRLRFTYDRLPIGMNDLESYKKNLVELSNYSLGFPSNDKDVKLYSDKKFSGIPDQPYVVISNGVDTDHGGVRLTKCWDYWNDFVCSIGMNVVQVGTPFDEAVIGTIDLRGKTSIKQLLYVIKKARAVIATEGGIMHLCKAVGQPNTFILRGPTRGNIFNYKSQHNIDSDVCEPCYFSRKGWDEYCITGLNCMSYIKPDRVIDRVLSTL